MLDIAMINSRKLYERDAENLIVQKKNILHLASFKLSIANALIKKEKAQTDKRGRASLRVQNSNPERSRSNRCLAKDVR